jgi:RNA polymerase sigma factor (sigma-70 family)
MRLRDALQRAVANRPSPAAARVWRGRSIVAMTTFFSVQDTSAVNDLRVLSEEQLIAAAKTGRRAPFGELCERHMKQVFGVTRRIMPNREDVEDAVQDCFLNAFVHLKDFDGRSQFATWLTRIAINAALMKLRKKRGVQEVPIDEPNPSFEPVAQREFRDGAPDPEESCSLRERKRIVVSAISGLRPRVRNVVELIHLQEHSIRETAQILGISTGAVKARMFHAKIKLHRMPLLQSVGSSNCVRQAE